MHACIWLAWLQQLYHLICLVRHNDQVCICIDICMLHFSDLITHLLLLNLHLCHLRAQTKTEQAHTYRAAHRSRLIRRPCLWEILPISYLVMTIWLYTCPCLQHPLCWRWKFVNVIYFICVWSKYFVLVFLDITAALLVLHNLFWKILYRIMKSIKAYFENLLNILEIVSWLDTQFHHSNSPMG